jgi:hypothetical protein
MILIFHFIYGMSSFPLTNSIIFFKWLVCTTNQIISSPLNNYPMIPLLSSGHWGSRDIAATSWSPGSNTPDKSKPRHRKNDLWLTQQTSKTVCLVDNLYIYSIIYIIIYIYTTNTHIYIYTYVVLTILTCDRRSKLLLEVRRDPKAPMTITARPGRQRVALAWNRLVSWFPTCFFNDAGKSMEIC